MRTASVPPTASDDTLDAVFGALADRTRRALMARLAQGPATITELALPFEMSFPAVSKHIRVLERGGLVARVVDGRVHRCQLTALALQDADQWLDGYRDFWQGALESLAHYAEHQPQPQRASRATGASATRKKR